MTSAAIIRCPRIRKHFDQILFLPLGQTPVMEKVQDLAFVQLTGCSLKVSLRLLTLFLPTHPFLSLSNFCSSDHLTLVLLKTRLIGQKSRS